MATIGELERRAGITDREAFWAPFSHYADGFDRGVRTLRVLAERRERAAAPDAAGEAHIPRDRSILERVADATAPYVLVAAIAALGALGMVSAVQLERYERQLVAEARI